VTPAERFEQLRDEMCEDTPEVTRSHMMGSPCLKVGPKMFCTFWDERLVVKVGGDDHAEALALDGAELFDPGRSGRKMREWVVVPFAHEPRWDELARAACEYVRL
jgi:hypothetical protein